MFSFVFCSYGNDLCLLDATYALLLFFLCLKTYVNYTVVGAFAVKTESRIAISEALEILTKWNPLWNPNISWLTLVNLKFKPSRTLSQVGSPGRLQIPE